MSSQKIFSSNTLALLLVGLVIGAGGGYLTSSNSSRILIADLEGQISSLNSEISILNSEVVDANSEVDDLIIQVNSLMEDNSALETQVSELISQKSSLESQLESAQTTISEKEDDISTLQETIDDYEEQIEALEAQVDIYNAPPGYSRFSIYGISFEYPEEFLVSISGMLESTATEKSGQVMVSSTDESEVYSFGWLYTIIPPSLDGGLDGGFAELEEYNLILGSRETSEVNGHVMRYQDYEATIGDVTVYGVFATAYCTDSKNYLILTYTLEENPDVFPNFWRFIESIQCH